ncbi:MAG: hypothetical protein ACO3QK_02330 [Flavobacteriaceae bacterium]
MGRTAGTPNKITTEVRTRLETLIEGLVNSIDIEELTPNQRIKMLQIALQYTLPRLQAMVIKEENDIQPVFEVNILKRKENSNEETWIDNFESM